MRFDELIAPLTAGRFTEEYFGRKPAHIAAAQGSNRHALLSWSRLNELLAVRPHWTEANTKLILNSRPVTPELYLDELPGRPELGRLANPAKVEVFLAMGASLVANFIEDVAPEVRELTASLADRFGARTGANVYCSFQGIQAFPSHCDFHEVFAVQCEGEKVWNIYQNRAAAPVAALEGDDAQAIIDSAKGPVMMQARMRPGDVLYIPRGFYHDALASSGASLHVTLSVAPLTGRAIFRLLEEEAIQEQAFREYLPDARAADGAPLADRLAILAERLAEMVRAPGFEARIAKRQRELRDPFAMLQLPERPALHFFARSNAPASFEPDDSGAALVSSGPRLKLGHLAAPAEWILARPAFAIEELAASFRHLDRSELEELASSLQRLGLIFPYKPEL